MLQKKQLIIIPILLILLAVLFYPVIFQGKIFSSPDSLNPQAVSIILEKTQKEIGEYPLWQPWIFSGMPTAESFTNTSNLYFLQYFFNLLHIPPIIIHLLHFFLAGLGMFILLRYLKLSQLIAIAAAAGFMLMPYLVTMEVFGHGSQAMTAAYIPWALWAALKLFDKLRIMDIGILALILGLQLQRAHVQIAYYTWMLIGALFLFKVILFLKDKNLRKNAVKVSGYFAIAIILAFGIAALVYLPSLQYSSESIRSVGKAGSASYDYATSWSLHPKEMMTFLIPSAYGFGGQTYWGKMPFTDYPNYMGIIFLLLAVFAVAKKRDTFVWFMAGTALLALLISFGSHFGIIYNLFYNLSPFFSKFRIPSMILILVQFNVIILAAYGFEELAKSNWKETPKWFWWIVGLTGATALLLLFGSDWLQGVVSTGFTQLRTQDPRLVNAINNLRWEMWIKDAWLTILFISGLLGSVFLLSKGKISKLIFVIIIGALALIDIGIVDQKIVQPSKNSGRSSRLVSSKAIERYFRHDKVTQFLAEDKSDFRVYPIGQLFGESRLQAFGIESVGGYHPAKLGIYSNFLSKTNNISTLPLMRMMNIHYLLSPQVINHPNLEEVFTDKMQTGSGNIQMLVYRLSESLPRAWFVENVEVIDEDNLWKKLLSDSFDPIKIAYIKNAKNISAGTDGNVEWYESSIHHHKINTTSSKDGFLVISEIHYPLRWKATIDGEPVETIKTNGVLRGIQVPAGEHTIKFEYDQSVFHKGIAISIVAFLLALSLVGFGIFNKRESK